MALNDSAALLFTISADASQAHAELAGLPPHVAASLDQIAAATKAASASILDGWGGEFIERDRLGQQMRDEAEKQDADFDQKQSERYARELAALREHLTRLVTEEMTARQKLDAELDQQVAQAQARRDEARDNARGPEQEDAADTAYFKVVDALMTAYQKDLNALQNSQGWQGVFGSKFAQTLRGNETALKEWVTSSNQSLLMLRMSLEALDGMGRQAFEHLAQGMGGGIASAIVYSRSIGEAMRAALAATLEAIAAESMVQAIYAMALGFLRLAQHDFAGADAAFTSAAIFGTVGGAAAVAGRFAAPSRNAGTEARPSGSGAAAGEASGSGASTPASQSQPSVHVYVQGNLVGWTNIDELTSAINDAVLNRDVTLTATNTSTGVQVVR